LSFTCFWASVRQPFAAANAPLPENERRIFRPSRFE
jgi:hypothetical protein